MLLWTVVQCMRRWAERGANEGRWLVVSSGRPERLELWLGDSSARWTGREGKRTGMKRVEGVAVVRGHAGLGARSEAGTHVTQARVREAGAAASECVGFRMMLKGGLGGQGQNEVEDDCANSCRLIGEIVRTNVCDKLVWATRSKAREPCIRSRHGRTGKLLMRRRTSKPQSRRRG